MCLDLLPVRLSGHARNTTTRVRFSEVMTNQLQKHEFLLTSVMNLSHNAKHAPGSEAAFCAAIVCAAIGFSHDPEADIFELGHEQHCL